MVDLTQPTFAPYCNFLSGCQGWSTRPDVFRQARWSLLSAQGAEDVSEAEQEPEMPGAQTCLLLLFDCERLGALEGLEEEQKQAWFAFKNQLVEAHLRLHRGYVLLSDTAGLTHEGETYKLVRGPLHHPSGPGGQGWWTYQTPDLNDALSVAWTLITPPPHPEPSSGLSR